MRVSVRRATAPQGRLAAPAICLIALLAAACGDATPTDQPDPDAGRYEGPVDPCEVQAPPTSGEVVPADLASAAHPVVLPALREGHLRQITAPIRGSSASALLSGALPEGLSLRDGVVFGKAAPGTSGGDEARIYRFEVAPDDPDAAFPVEVRIAVYPPGPVEAPDDLSSIPRYFEPGPYPVWNTQPLESCPQNPTIDLVGDEPDVDMYVVYPTEGDPTRTGQGPVAEGRWPVILFAHANNDRVCDINERYLSLHDHWASWGFIVVAVDGTFTNCNSGTRANIELRAEGLLKALLRLEALHDDPTSRLYGRVDLDNVVLAGHSRGGGASLLAASLDPRVRAVIDLQGVDMTSFGFGDDPLAPVPVIGLTAGEDVDLNYPIVEPTEDQLSGPYTWVNLNGAIHAYTADTAPIEPDDLPLISQQQQHDLTEFFTTAFLDRFVGVGDGSPQSAPRTPSPQAAPALFSHAGARLVDAEISGLGVFVRWNQRFATALVIDRFDGPKTLDPASLNDLGGDNVFEDLARADEVLTYIPDGGNRRNVHLKANALRLVARAEGPGVFRTFLRSDREPEPVDPGATLQARVKGPDQGPAGIAAIEILTPEGAARLPLADFIGPEPLKNRFTQLSVPLDAFPFPQAPAAITSVAVILESGTLFIDDLRID